MLPLFDIKIEDIALIGFNPRTGNTCPIGSSFLFSYESVLGEAEQAGTNFDMFLTSRLAKFLSKKKPKTNLLIFYAPVNGYFYLTICSSKSVDFCGILHSSAGMPGYIESGQDYVPENAKPFLYYAGFQVFRVYDVENLQSSAYYVSDFGNLFGLTTSIADEENYKDIANNPMEYLEYCAVPTEPTTRFIGDNSEILINHAFVRIT